ncbi:MAG: hypothetical protein FWD57_07595, partial [Polyangiaceae bacterium]|nr:hypothetical protein [Polyangiaceae bacterium]
MDWPGIDYARISSKRQVILYARTFEHDGPSEWTPRCATSRGGRDCQTAADDKDRREVFSGSVQGARWREFSHHVTWVLR